MSEKTLTEANFKEEVIDASAPVLVDFWAEWCGPCKMLSPVVERLAEANEGKITVGKLNVDENQKVAQEYGVQGIPSLLFFKDGKVVQQMVGFQSEENIQQIIDKVVA